MIRIAALTLLLAMALPLSAQIIPKDGEDDTATIPCPVISGPFRFCGSSPDFVLTPQTDNLEITSYYATPEGIQAVVIAEPLGTADGMTIPGLQEAALEILSWSTGQEPSEIPILERTRLPVADQDWPNFVYSGTVDGTPIVYSNTIVVLAGDLAQFVTLELGVTTLTPRHRDLHDRFLAQVQVIP